MTRNSCSGVREECGVFGIYDLDGNDVANSIYYGLEALQHRGQESCGIAVSDTEGPKGRVRSRKGLGLVNEVFKAPELEALRGNIGIGHVRYSTSGSSSIENAQPLVLNYIKGSLALAHNGNLINARELREQMENSGAIFHTSIDSEVIAYCIARERVRCGSVEEAVRRACSQIRGAYGLVIMSPRKLVEAPLSGKEGSCLYHRLGKLRGHICGRGIYPGYSARRNCHGHKRRGCPFAIPGENSRPCPLYL